MTIKRKKIKMFFSLFLFVLLVEGAKASYFSPSPEEAEARAFRRVFRNLQTVFQQNAADITILNQEQFFKNKSKVLSQQSTQALLRMRDNSDCSMIHSYVGNIAELKEDLKKTQTCFKEDQTTKDLNENEVKSLKKYAKALLKIIKAFR